MANFSANVLHGLRRFLLPQLCVFCRTPSDQNAACDDCRESFLRPIEHQCQRCGAEVGPYSSVDSDCVHCRKFSLNFGSVTCLGMYHEDMRQAILSAKFGHSSVGLQVLAGLLLEHHQARLEGLKANFIIPMPQFLQSRLHRSFNAADPIAERIAKGLRLPVDRHILRRRGRSKPQKRVGLSERFENQRDTFRIRDAHLLKKKEVLLVDDVMTTGATCREATRLLKKAGAKKVHIVILARVLSTPPKAKRVTDE